MAEGPILPYSTFPFQHSASARPEGDEASGVRGKEPERIAAWRAVCPDITIRSTFIAGFRVRRKRSSSTCSTSSVRRAWTAWGALRTRPSKAPRRTNSRGAPRRSPRRAPPPLHGGAGGDFGREKLAEKIGKTLEVIIDEPEDEDGVAVGRTKADAPDIDGVRYVTTDRHLTPGDIVRVRITANEEHDLIGHEVVE